MQASIARRPDNDPAPPAPTRGARPSIDETPPTSKPIRRGNERLFILVGLAIGSLIAAIAPFDNAFDMLTGGSAVLRVLALPAFGLAGIFFARRVGLPVSAAALRHSLRTPLLIALGVAIAVAVIDGFVFRAILPAEYVHSMTSVGTGERLIYFMLRAVNEQILYRLFLMSVLVWGLGLVWRGENGRPANGAYWLAILLAQVINISINVPLPETPLLLLYDTARYICPGIVWGYLYWRHGFATAELAHVGTHPFLQPALGILLP